MHTLIGDFIGILTDVCMCVSHTAPTNSEATVRVKKKPRFRSVLYPVPFRFYSRFNRSVPFTSVLTVYRGQTVLALCMNSSVKFTACVGEA